MKDLAHAYQRHEMQFIIGRPGKTDRCEKTVCERMKGEIAYDSKEVSFTGVLVGDAG